MAAALAANAIEIQQQIKIIDACEKYRTWVSFIPHDLRRSTGVLSNHHDDDAQREETPCRRFFAMSTIAKHIEVYQARQSQTRYALEFERVQ